MSTSIPIRHIRRLSTTTTSATHSSISISKAKSKLRSEHDPDKALEIYSSVSSRYSPTSSRYAQDLAVRRLAKSHRFSDIESFIESHKNDPKITQEPYLSTLIRSYGRAGMFDHALKTYDQMDNLGTPRTSVSFNSLLTACNLSKQFDRVPQLFDEIPTKYNVVSPDEVSYGILIKAYCEAGKPEKAIETVRMMEEKGIEVTAVAFTTVYNALYKKGSREEAEKLWDEMVGKGCKVDAAAYNVKIMYAHVDGSAEDVNGLLDEMVAAGLKPDAISYNYLMSCYCRDGRMEEAEKVYKGLEGYKLNPNAATFRILVFNLCKNELFERAYRVFKKSVEVHKIPDFGTLKLLAEGLMKKNLRKEVKGLIRTVKKKSPPNMLNAWKKLEEGLGLVPEELDASCVPHDDDEEKRGSVNRKQWKKPNGKKTFPRKAGNDWKKVDTVTSSVPRSSAKEATG